MLLVTVRSSLISLRQTHMYDRKILRPVPITYFPSTIYTTVEIIRMPVVLVTDNSNNVKNIRVLHVKDVQLYGHFDDNDDHMS